MTTILATVAPQLVPFQGTVRVKAKPGDRLMVFRPVLYVDGVLTEIQGVRTYALRVLAERRALRAARHYQRKHPTQQVTVVRPMVANSAAWERAANREARSFTPGIVPCDHCQGPRIKGYVCTRCRVGA